MTSKEWGRWVGGIGVAVPLLACVTTGLPPAVVAPRPVVTQAPAGSAGSREGVGLLLRVDQLALPRGDLWRTRGDVGMVFRPLDRLAVDVGLGAGGGGMLRLDGPDTFLEMGLSVDARVFLTPYSPVQVFLLGGVGFGGMSATLRTRTPRPGEDCPRDEMFFADLSAGIGAEIALSRSVSLVASGRVVLRERLSGDLVLAVRQVNPPLVASEHLVGASFGLTLVVYGDGEH